MRVFWGKPSAEEAEEKERALDATIERLTEEAMHLERNIAEHDRRKFPLSDARSSSEDEGDQEQRHPPSYKRAMKWLDHYSVRNNMASRLTEVYERKSAALTERHPRALNPRVFGSPRMKLEYFVSDSWDATRRSCSKLVRLLIRAVTFALRCLIMAARAFVKAMIFAVLVLTVVQMITLYRYRQTSNEISSSSFRDYDYRYIF